MTQIRLFMTAAALTGMFLVAACSHFSSGEKSLPASHPEALEEGRVSCSECHEDQIRGILKPYAAFSHSTNFIANHQHYAAQNDQLCASCHKRAFCNDCHTAREVMTPAQKYGDRPDREMIHRGDYITRHKIDGKQDPASCYKCHGRGNNRLCMTCHRS